MYLGTRLLTLPTVNRQRDQDHLRNWLKEETSFYGLMQPFADALKLFLKEVVIPSTSNRNLFLGAPMLTLALAFIG